MGKRVVFTGGSGKVGRYLVPYLLPRGHHVLNLDLVPLDLPGVNTMIVDLVDSGETFNALSTHFGFDEIRSGKRAAPADAVVHFAAIPRILLRPDNAMFATNVLSTYNILEAAAKLGIRKVIIASSAARRSLPPRIGRFTSQVSHRQDRPRNRVARVGETGWRVA